MALARRIDGTEVRGGEPKVLGTPMSGVDAFVVPDAASVQRGYDEGLAAAREVAEVEREELLATLRAAEAARLAEAVAALDAQREAYRQGCVRLAMEVADDRLWAEGLAVEIAHAALARWSGEHTHDVAWLTRCCAELMKDMPRVGYVVRVATADAALLEAVTPGIELCADASLAIGDIVIETPRGDLDMGIRTRMDLLRDTLLGTLAQVRATP